MQLKPWHVPFSVVGGPDVQMCLIEPDRVVITHPEHCPMLVDLDNGDCTDVPEYGTSYFVLPERV